MASERPDHDETVVEIIYLLVALTAPVVAAIVVVAGACDLFGLHSGGWHVLALVLIVAAVAIGAGFAGNIVRSFRATDST